MRCHYVEKRIYLIQTRYVLLQHACQKLANQVILLIYCHLSFPYPSNRSGETGEHVGNNSPEIGEMQKPSFSSSRLSIWKCTFFMSYT